MFLLVDEIDIASYRDNISYTTGHTPNVMNKSETPSKIFISGLGTIE